MLGSRYLNPYFGSGIYTWASLISTVLAALCAGYFVGGIAADRYPSAAVLGATVVIGFNDTRNPDKEVHIFDSFGRKDGNSEEAQRRRVQGPGLSALREKDTRAGTFPP